MPSKAELQEAFVDLETRLILKGVEICWPSYVRPELEIRRLALGSFLGTIVHYLWEGNDGYMQWDELPGKKFRRLLRNFMANRKNPDYELPVVRNGWSDRRDLEKNYLMVGRIANPDYGTQLRDVVEKYDAHNRGVALRLQKVKEILDSGEGKTFQEVISEYEKKICSTCYGAGEQGSQE